MNTPIDQQEVIGDSGQANAGGERKKITGSWNKTNTRTQMSSVTYKFTGAKSEIGVVLGLKHSRGSIGESLWI